MWNMMLIVATVDFVGRNWNMWNLMIRYEKAGCMKNGNEFDI